MRFVEYRARKASARLAKYAHRKNRRNTPAETFKASWQYLLSSRLYRFFIWLGQNRDREGTQLKGRTFELLSFGIPDFYCTTKIVIANALKQALENPKPFLIVHIHDGHHFLTRVFEDYLRDSTRIVEDPAGHIQWLRQFGVDVSRFHVVKDDLFSFARLRNAVLNNHVILCAIDYTDARGRRAYINPAIFGYANGAGIPVFFVKSHVNDAGIAELISAGPYENVEPTQCGNMFLEFFNAVGSSRVKMQVKRYNEHSDWRRRDADTA